MQARAVAAMKTVGLLGGMSWQSTVSYYETINRLTAERLGGLHSAQIVLYSVDFQPLEELQHQGRWREAGERLAEAARALERAGADFLVLCTNTMHKVAPQIEEAVRMPLLHIADATAERVRAGGLLRVGLLGTRFTMEQEFYCGRLRERHGLDVLVPPEAQRDRVHRVIYEVVADLVGRGAQGIILGCTEIGLLLRPGDAAVPLFDTTEIHAEAAVRYALA
jgi:aspartate racemase